MYAMSLASDSAGDEMTTISAERTPCKARGYERVGASATPDRSGGFLVRDKANNNRAAFETTRTTRQNTDVEVEGYLVDAATLSGRHPGTSMLPLGSSVLPFSVL